MSAGWSLGYEERGGPFFACSYLLTPCPSKEGKKKHGSLTYVGFTLHPKRRLRQHNGELKQGAYFTRKHRPWDMTMCVHGFRCSFSALQFEYAWQNPYTCRYTRQALAPIRNKRIFGGRHSLRRKLLEVHLMLRCCQPWCHYALAVRYLEPYAEKLAANVGNKPCLILIQTNVVA